MHFQILPLLLLAGWFTEYGHACSCIQSHPQRHFCNADFVMQVRLRSESETIHKKSEIIKYDPVTKENKTIIIRTELEVKYNVKVRRVYKMKENSLGLSMNSTVATLFTAPDDAMCGVFLEVRTNYLISGYFQDDKPWLMLCSWNSPWAWVSKMQRKYLRSIYAENCECKITENGGWLQDDPKVDNGCTGVPYSPRGKCHPRNSACIKDKNSTTGGCKWHRNRSMKECRATSRNPRIEP